MTACTTRRLRYMGKDSIWKVKALNPIIDALGAFPVHRGTADREALRTSIAVVESGQPLVMFPEGTRQSGPVVQELFDGPAYVAAKSGAPIVPVGITGTGGAGTLRLRLELRHPVQPTDRGYASENPGKLRMLGNMGLDKNRRLFRVYAACQVQGSDLKGFLPEASRVHGFR